MSADFYRVLDLPASASQADIKAAFRRLAVRYHPDISREHNCVEKFAQINIAYETLSDPAARATYDIQRTSPARRPNVRYHAAQEDPIYEMLRRHRERHRADQRHPFGATSMGDWHERERWWQKEKQEAAEYKERRQRLHARMQQAHTSRIAKALSTQWPAQAGLNRYDMVAASVFTAGIALMSSFWLAPVDGAALEGPDAVQATDVAADASRPGPADATSSLPMHNTKAIVATRADESSATPAVLKDDASEPAQGMLSPLAAARMQALDEALRGKTGRGARSSDDYDESLAGIA